MDLRVKITASSKCFNIERSAQENQTKAIALLLKPDRLKTPTLKRMRGPETRKQRNKENLIGNYRCSHCSRLEFKLHVCFGFVCVCVHQWVPVHVYMAHLWSRCSGIFYFFLFETESLVSLGLCHILQANYLPVSFQGSSYLCLPFPSAWITGTHPAF